MEAKYLIDNSVKLLIHNYKY